MKKGRFPNMEEVDMVKEFVQSDMRNEKVKAYGFGTFNLLCGFAVLICTIFRVFEVISWTLAVRLFYDVLGVLLIISGCYIYYAYFRLKSETSSMRFFIYECTAVKYYPARHRRYAYVEAKDGSQYRVSKKHYTCNNPHYKIAILDSSKVNYCFAFPANIESR